MATQARASNSPTKEYFTLPEMAQYSGLGVRTLRDAIKDGEHPLPHFRVGHKTILISRTDFAEWLDRFRVDQGGEIDRLVKLALVGVCQ